jgi:hypothetical protein
LSENNDFLDKLGISADELLYNSYSLSFLSQNIDMLNHISRGEGLSQNLIRILIFDIVAKYCQLVESFAAFINAFEESNTKTPTVNIVFNHLVTYRVADILKNYNLFLEDSPKINDYFKEKIKTAFGYNSCNDAVKANQSIMNIFELLVKIFQIYHFHEKIYNASKHGHRIFHFHNFDGNENEPIVYLDRKPKDYFNLRSNGDEKYLFDYIPISRPIIDDMIIPRRNELNKLYDILINNNKAILGKRFKEIRFLD